MAHNNGPIDLQGVEQANEVADCLKRGVERRVGWRRGAAATARICLRQV